MSVNKVILVGNVGRDPEVNYPQSGVAVAKFSLATTDRGYKLQNGTEVPARTEWHNIICWRRLGEFAENYIRKGQQLFIEGKLQTSSWEKDGITRYRTEIVASDIQFVGKKGETVDVPSQKSQSNDNNHSDKKSSNTNSAQTKKVDAPAADETDDLPF